MCAISRLRLETIVRLTWIKRSATQHQCEPVAQRVRQSQHRLPCERRRLEVRLNHQVRHVAVLRPGPLAIQLDGAEEFTQQRAQLGRGELSNVEAIGGVPFDWSKCSIWS